MRFPATTYLKTYLHHNSTILFGIKETKNTTPFLATIFHGKGIFINTETLRKRNLNMQMRQFLDQVMKYICSYKILFILYIKLNHLMIGLW